MRSLIFALVLAPTLLLAQTAPKPATAATPTQSGSTTTAGKAIQWLTPAEAQERTKKAPKPIFMDVYTQWCGPCKMLDRNTFSDPRLADYVNKHFYPVKFDAESATPVVWKGQKLENPDFNPALVGNRNGTHHLTYMVANVNGAIAYPTVVYMDSDLNVLAPVQGYMTPQQMEPILMYFAEGHYKTSDYQTFMATFKAKW